MKSRHTAFRSVRLSLRDLLGADYTDTVCAACARLTGEPIAEPRTLANVKVEFFPVRIQERMLSLLRKVGRDFTAPFENSARGATTAQFAAHSKNASAPLSTMGYYRVGEDGRLYLITKSEHYHTPLGHAFPGYRLVELAGALGVPNATHNNTRGHIARMLEEELVRVAGGLMPDDRTALDHELRAKRHGALNRVLNLETGSLAAEAAIKIVLNRFYAVQDGGAAPKYAGRVPVLVVIGDDEGGLQANYHGTNITAQIMRGMWPEMRKRLEKSGTLVVRAVRPNDIAGLNAAFEKFDSAPYKIAGFFHELVLMNYAGKRLSEKFIRRAYALCARHDVPAMVDEIQTGLWSPELFMYREYGLKPALVAIGKGFPGGEYPASRLLFTADLDTLPQFGALVTNGQEELASLAYLITMRWAEANAEVTSAVGEYYEARLRELGDEFSDRISAIEGRRHLAGIYFHDLKPATAFAQHLNAAGLDISVQTYKAGCPPSALTKLPLIAGYEVVDFVLEKMRGALNGAGN
ncbi:MAG: aminotransferase class III-fold pyridoxal phosphate-dependent enzyme [Candidatus Hydrogenedentes bacterium]|nr:aminotransferase class III-fold pyridoxal phosphate-dependent enzyme [Candidatus Hydrogenedentota bacterium]